MGASQPSWPPRHCGPHLRTSRDQPRIVASRQAPFARGLERCHPSGPTIQPTRGLGRRTCRATQSRTVGRTAQPCGVSCGTMVARGKCLCDSACRCGCEWRHRHDAPRCGCGYAACLGLGLHTTEPGALSMAPPSPKLGPHPPRQSPATLLQARCHLPPHALIRPFSSGPLRPAGFGGRFGGMVAQCPEVTPLPCRTHGVSSIEQGFELCGVYRLQLASQNQPELPATQCTVETHPF